MSDPILLLNQPYVMVVSAIATPTTSLFTIPTTGQYNATAQMTAPPGTGLTLILKQNGTTIYTSPVFGQTQTALQVKFDFQATAADVIEFEFTSTVTEDAALNVIQAVIQVGQGY